jgi:hypothetical protein
MNRVTSSRRLAPARNRTWDVFTVDLGVKGLLTAFSRAASQARSVSNTGPRWYAPDHRTTGGKSHGRDHSTHVLPAETEVARVRRQRRARRMRQVAIR